MEPAMLTGHDLLTVERALQVALAPAFVLGGIIGLLGLMNARLQRISDRERELREEGTLEATRLRPSLRRRGRMAYSAIISCILACIALCLLVIVSFVEPLFGVGAGVHVVGLLVCAMALLTFGLLLYLFELLTSTRGLDRGEL
jgi:hypothetical protein